MHSHPRTHRIGGIVDVTMVAGAGLLAWSGGIHLDLWHDGYSTVPTIGTLFFLQAVSALTLAAVILATRRLYPALAGGALLAMTVAGLVWSVEWGLFGFRDSLSAPFAVESLAVESAGVAVLAAACVLRCRDVRLRAGARASAHRRG